VGLDPLAVGLTRADGHPHALAQQDRSASRLLERRTSASSPWGPASASSASPATRRSGGSRGPSPRAQPRDVQGFLFLGAGAVVSRPASATSTPRQLLPGCLDRRRVLTGSLSISGLRPANGFAGSSRLLRGVPRDHRRHRGARRPGMLVVVGLSLIGGWPRPASPRRSGSPSSGAPVGRAAATEVAWLMRIPMALLAAACLLVSRRSSSARSRGCCSATRTSPRGTIPAAPPPRSSRARRDRRIGDGPGRPPRAGLPAAALDRVLGRRLAALLGLLLLLQRARLAGLTSPRR
jgi:hypothetical protein